MFAAQLIRGTGGVLAALVCTTACVGARASVRPVPTGVTVPSSASCFAVSTLSPADQQVADRVLLEFADREGLYTLGDGIKPISSNVRDLSVRIAPTLDTLALATLDQQRRVAAALTCGEIGAVVQVFTATQRRRDSSEVRSTSMVLYHRGAVRRTIEAHAAFFSMLGVTPSTDPRDVIQAVENAPRSPRWRGYGYLFGYPDDAVDFFVRAGEAGDASGTLVPRDFRRIDTWHKYAESAGAAPTQSSFVFAVPKGAPESEQERRLRAAAAPVYARYVQARRTAIQPDSTGALALFQRWLTAGR